MADGTTLNTMSGGDKIRDIDRGANGKTQVVQVDVGGASAEALLTLGQQAKAASLPVVLASDQGTVAVQVGKSLIVLANFTRPANTTAYVSGQLVANSTTAGSVVPLSFSNVVRVNGAGGLVRRAKLRKTGTSITSASFRIHFYAVTETSSVGDGVAIVLPDTANYRGKMDVTMDQAFSDGACGFGIPAVGDSIIVNPASGTSLFAFIEARAAYTPTSGEVFTVELDILED